MIELIITLLIGSILLAWGVPNYRDFKVRKQVTDYTNDLIYSITSARAEAIRYGQTVRFRAKGGGASKSWNRGANTIKVIVGSANEKLADLRAFDDSVTITQTGGVADLNFNSIGSLPAGTQFRIENTAVLNAFRIVQVLPSGTVRVVRP